MNDAIETVLDGIGVRCTVERRGPLAVLTPLRGDRGLERAEVRRAVLSALRAYGFTHAAVEVADEDERT